MTDLPTRWTTVEHSGADAQVLTMSVGLAARGPRLPAAQHVLQAADVGLYAAKGAGRNRVVAAPVASTTAAG